MVPSSLRPSLPPSLSCQKSSAVPKHVSDASFNVWTSLSKDALPMAYVTEDM